MQRELQVCTCKLRIHVCGGKCRVQLQAHSSASPEGSEIDRKSLEVQNFK